MIKPHPRIVYWLPFGSKKTRRKEIILYLFVAKSSHIYWMYCHKNVYTDRSYSRIAQKLLSIRKILKGWNHLILVCLFVAKLCWNVLTDSSKISYRDRPYPVIAKSLLFIEKIWSDETTPSLYVTKSHWNGLTDFNKILYRDRLYPGIVQRLLFVSN